MRPEQQIKDRIEYLTDAIKEIYASKKLEGVEYYEEERNALMWVLEGD